MMATFRVRIIRILGLFLLSGSFIACELWYTTDCWPGTFPPRYNAGGSADGTIVYVADSGRVFIEGGIHCSGWKTLEVAGFPDLNDITFWDNDGEGNTIVGDNGTLLRLTPDHELDFLANPYGSANLNAVSTGFPTLPVAAVGDAGAAIKSIDHGLTWVAMNSPTSSNLHAVCVYSSDKIFISGEDYSFYVSTDGGDSWDPTGPVVERMGGSQSSYNRIYFYDDNLGFVGGPHGLILKTTDGGLNWESRFAQGFDEVNDLYFIDPDSGVAVGPGGAARFTTDGGENWFEEMDVTDFLDGREVRRIFPFGRIFGTILGEGLGTFIAPDSTYLDSTLVTSIDEDIPFPAEFKLSQNYPNPFNAISNFEIRVARLGDVSLKVYDLLGREVATIFDERLPAGRYTRRWDAAGQPSGVYFYRLQAVSYVETRKLVLLR